MKYEYRPIWLAAPVLAGVITWFAAKDPALTGFAVTLFLFISFAQIYIPYAKDNPQNFWFKRKLYGWGWTPVTWQGWLATLVYVASVTFFALTIDETSPSEEIAFTFFLPLVLLTITFLRIAYKKGERPRWQWGRDDDHKDDTDQ